MWTNLPHSFLPSQISCSASSVSMLRSNNFAMLFAPATITQLLWYFVLRQVGIMLQYMDTWHKVPRGQQKPWKPLMTELRTLSKVHTALPVDRTSKRVKLNQQRVSAAEIFANTFRNQRTPHTENPFPDVKCYRIYVMQKHQNLH